MKGKRSGLLRASGQVAVPPGVTGMPVCHGSHSAWGTGLVMMAGGSDLRRCDGLRGERMILVARSPRGASAVGCRRGDHTNYLARPKLLHHLHGEGRDLCGREHPQCRTLTLRILG